MNAAIRCLLLAGLTSLLVAGQVAATEPIIRPSRAKVFLNPDGKPGLVVSYQNMGPGPVSADKEIRLTVVSATDGKRIYIKDQTHGYHTGLFPEGHYNQGNFTLGNDYTCAPIQATVRAFVAGAHASEVTEKTLTVEDGGCDLRPSQARFDATQVQVTVHNDGPGPLVAPSGTHVTAQASINQSAKVPGTVLIASATASVATTTVLPGSSLEKTVNFALPKSYKCGPLSVTVTVDTPDVFLESKENNNSQTMAVTNTPLCTIAAKASKGEIDQAKQLQPPQEILSNAKAGIWLTLEQEVLALAAQKQVPILVAFVNLATCGKCKKLESQVFASPVFQQWAKNVVLWRVDWGTASNQSCFATAQKYGAVSGNTISWPQIVKLTATGHKVGQLPNAQALSAEQFIQAFDAL